MPTQNLISASMTPETKTEILGILGRVKDRLDFLLTLAPNDIKTLFKAGNGYAPFIEKAYNTVNEFPQILPTVFDAVEFQKDFELIKDLTPIANLVNQLADSIQNTMMAAGSDALAGGLEVYAAVKQNRKKVPGLNVVAEEMSVFFQKPGKKSAPLLKQVVNS